MASSPHTPEPRNDVPGRGSTYFVRSIRPDFGPPIAASVKLQNTFGITHETREQLKHDEITAPTMEETRGKKCLGEPLQFEVRTPPPPQWCKSMDFKHVSQPMPNAHSQAGQCGASHQPMSGCIPQTPRSLGFNPCGGNGITNPLKHSPLTKRNLSLFERQLRQANAGSLSQTRSSGSSGYSFASGFSGGTLRHQMGGTGKQYKQHHAPPAHLPVIHGTRRSRVSKSQSKAKKRAVERYQFGRPGPIGYWIPDEGVQRQKAPLEGSTATEGSVQGVGGNQLSEEIPDYGGCEIWHDDEGDVVEQRGKGWNHN